MSAVEAVANVMVGWGVSMLLTWALLPAFGYAVSVRDAFGISIAFTAVSIVRSFLLRRLFNGLSA